MAIAGVNKVIVLAGGPSMEADISRTSAAGMCGALRELGLAHELWELEGDWLQRLANQPRDGLFVLLGLHGCPGEDGSIQAVLELLDIPYQGSGVAASALAMDKIRSRLVLQGAGLPVAAGLWGDAAADLNRLAEFMDEHGTVVVKPANGGSSVGVSLVKGFSQLGAAIADAEKLGPVLVEEFISGKELTVSCLGSRALAVTEIVPQGSVFYDFKAKYSTGGSVHHTPAALPEAVTARLQQGAVQAARALGLAGAYRMDFRYDVANDRAVILEANTLPGMTPTSLLPEAAQHVGMTYAAVVRWMIEDGKNQWTIRHGLTPSAPATVA